MGQTVMGNMTVRSAIRSLLTYDGSEYLVHATSNEHQPEVRPLADNYCSTVRGSQTSHGGKYLRLSSRVQSVLSLMMIASAYTSTYIRTPVHRTQYANLDNRSSPRMLSLHFRRHFRLSF